jgi:pimeloyl-ACP methyl ester carboxylesterase
MPFEMVPEDMDLPYEVFVVESDGARIHAWFLPAAEPSGDTVLVCGGNTGNKGLYVPLARELRRRGYNTVLMDYRGFGFSTGEPDLWELVDDTEAVLEAVAARPDTERVALFGMSLGSVVALGVASREDAEVRAVISECTVHPALALEDEVGGFLGGILDVFVTPSSWDVEEIAAETPVPIFFIHGTKDSITRLDRAQLIFRAAERADAPRYVWIAEDVGHTPEFAGLFGSEYVDRLVTFLDATMKGRGDCSDLTGPREPSDYTRCRLAFEEAEADLYRGLGEGVPLRLGGMTMLFTFGADEEIPPEELLRRCRDVEARLGELAPDDPDVAPLYAPIWRLLGKKYQELDRAADALRAYGRSVALVPERPHAFFYFTSAGWDLGWDLNEVADTLERMSGLADTEEQKLEYLRRSVDWRERAKARWKFLGEWEEELRRACG